MADEATGSESTISVETELDTLREGIDDPQILKGQLGKEAQARRQITARAIKAESDAKAYKAKIAELEAATKTITNEPSPTQSVAVIDDRVELRLQGYSKKEVEWVMQNGGPKVLEDPNSLVSIAIKAQREQVAAEAAASQTIGTGSMTEVERKLTPISRNAGVTDLKKSVAEMEALLPHAE